MRSWAYFDAFLKPRSLGLGLLQLAGSAQNSFRGGPDHNQSSGRCSPQNITAYNPEALSFLAYPSIYRNSVIIEEHFVSIDSLAAHLFDLRQFEPGSVLIKIYEEERETS